MVKFKQKMYFIVFLVIALKLLGVLYRIFSTRMLGLEGMRLMSMITPSLSLALCMSSLSIQSVCNQNIALNISTKRIRVSNIMLSAFRVIMTSTTIISILLLLSFPLYKYLYNDYFIYYPLLLCIPLLYLSNISGVMKGYLEANNRFITTYFANVVELITKLLLTIFLLIIFKDFSIQNKVILAYLALSLSELSSCLILSLKIKKKIRKNTINFKEINYSKNILKQAIPLTLESLIQTISGYITPFIFYYACKQNNISFYESTTFFALTTSYAIPLLINGQFATMTLAKFLFPSITKIRDNHKALSKLINKALCYIIVASTLCFCLCFFYTNDFLNLMYGDIKSNYIVRFLAPVYLILYFDPLFLVILQAYNKEKTLFKISIISQLITIISIYLLSINPFINTFGFIIGLAIGSIIKCTLLCIFSFKASKYKPSLNILSFILLSIIYIFFCLIYHNFLYFIIISLLYSLLSLLIYLSIYNNRLFDFQKLKHT